MRTTSTPFALHSPTDAVGVGAAHEQEAVVRDPDLGAGGVRRGSAGGQEQRGEQTARARRGREAMPTPTRPPRHRCAKSDPSPCAGHFSATPWPLPSALSRSTLPAPLLRLRSDEQLLALFRAGREDAFRAIHDRYHERLLAYVRHMLRGHSEAEDVVQDVFMRASSALRTGEREIAVRPWLYRVAHNRCIDYVRRAPAAPLQPDELLPGGIDPVAAAEQREDLRRLVADLHALPEQQRSALIIRELEGLSYDDLATTLGVTVPAVKSLLVRARTGLAEAGEARGDRLRRDPGAARARRRPARPPAAAAARPSARVLAVPRARAGAAPRPRAARKPPPRALDAAARRLARLAARLGRRAPAPPRARAWPPARPRRWRSRRPRSPSRAARWRSRDHARPPARHHRAPAVTATAAPRRRPSRSPPPARNHPPTAAAPARRAEPVIDAAPSPASGPVAAGPAIGEDDAPAATPDPTATPTPTPTPTPTHAPRRSPARRPSPCRPPRRRPRPRSPRRRRNRGPSRAISSAA